MSPHIGCQNIPFGNYEISAHTGTAAIVAYRSGRPSWLPMALGMLFTGVLMLAGNAAASDISPDAEIEQARAALSAGNDADALLLFQRVIASNPVLSNEPDLLNKIDEIYRLAGRTTPASLRPTAAGVRNATWMGFLPKGWLAVTAGSDTNINSASNLTSVPIPLLNNQSFAVPSPLLIEKPSAFAGLGGGLDLRHALSPQTRVLLYGQFQTRYNKAEVGYFPHNYYGAGAIQHSRGATEFTASVSHTQQWVARYRLLESSNIMARASYNALPGIEFSLAAESRSALYPYFSPIAARGNLLYFSARDSSKGLAASIMAGKDSTGGSAPELDRSVDGYAIEWGKDWGAHRLDLYASISHADYDATSPLFLTRRQDRNQMLAAEYSYRLNEAWKQWRLTPRLIDERNLSNIPISAYTRRQVMLELRREY